MYFTGLHAYNHYCNTTILLQYQVPMTDTTYYCSIRNLFNLVSDVNTQENPIYLYKVQSHLNSHFYSPFDLSMQVAPLISDANRRFVHHMLVFVCPIDSTINTDGICDEIANSFFGCFGGQIISAWAVGGEVSISKLQSNSHQEC